MSPPYSKSLGVFSIQVIQMQPHFPQHHRHSPWDFPLLPWDAQDLQAPSQQTASPWLAQFRRLLLPPQVHREAPWAKSEVHLKSCSSPSFILPRLSCRRKGTSLCAEQEIRCGSRLYAWILLEMFTLGRPGNRWGHALIQNSSGVHQELRWEAGKGTPDWKPTQSWCWKSLWSLLSTLGDHSPGTTLV